MSTRCEAVVSKRPASDPGLVGEGHGGEGATFQAEEGSLGKEQPGLVHTLITRITDTPHFIAKMG